MLVRPQPHDLIDTHPGTGRARDAGPVIPFFEHDETALLDLRAMRGDSSCQVGFGSKEAVVGLSVAHAIDYVVRGFACQTGATWLSQQRLRREVRE